MRCYCCNNILTPREACTKFKGSGEPTEMCKKCTDISEVETVSPQRDFDDDDEENNDNSD